MKTARVSFASGLLQPNLFSQRIDISASAEPSAIIQFSTQGSTVKACYHAVSCKRLLPRILSRLADSRDNDP